MSRAALDPPLAAWHQSDSAWEQAEISPPGVIISPGVPRSMAEVSLVFQKDPFRVLWASSPNKIPAAAGLCDNIHALYLSCFLLQHIPLLLYY